VKDKILRRVLACFLLAAIVLVVVAVNAVRNINRSVVTSDWVNQTHEVILESQALLLSLHAGDAAVRTFLLTGDPRERAASRAAFTQMIEHLEILQALTRSDPAAGAEMAELARLVTARADFANELGNRRANQAEPPEALLAADVGTGTTAEIQVQIDRLKSGQMALLAERDTASYLQAQATRWTVWAGVILDVLLLAGAVWLIRDDLAARRQVVSTLETANRDLDARVRERTAELAGSNEQLTMENLERRWTNQALEHQRRYDQLIINSINDLVLVLTKVVNISRINPPVIQATGFEPAELINKPFGSLVELQPGPGEASSPPRDPVAHALKAGRELRRTGRLRQKSGPGIPVRVAVYPLRDGDKVVGGVATLEVIPPTANQSGVERVPIVPPAS
jgi:CHASE3 domain sensor protein